MKRFALTLYFLFLSGQLLAQKPQNQPRVSVTQVAGPIFMIQGSGGGNIGVITDSDGVFVIDSMDERSAPEVRSALRSLPGGSRIKAIVNTHWHSDHTDGNRILGPECLVIAHENTRSLLARPQSLMGQSIKALPFNALPAITFFDTLTLYTQQGKIRLVHYPHAHTNGDTVVFMDNFKVIHMGDLFFNGMFPYLYVANGGDIENWVRQLDTIMSRLPQDVKIIPGHGPLASLADLRSFRQMLQDSAVTVRKWMQEGKTLDQIKAAGLPEKFAPWAGGFLSTAQWLELVYRSLEKQR